MKHHTSSASEKLDVIRTGGANLVLTAQQRLAEVKRALEAGHFSEAAIAAASLAEKLGQLAHAEQTCGRLASASILRVGELEVGDVVVDTGTVAKAAVCGNCDNPECVNVDIEFENGVAVTLERDAEILVAR